MTRPARVADIDMSKFVGFPPLTAPDFQPVMVPDTRMTVGRTVRYRLTDADAAEIAALAARHISRQCGPAEGWQTYPAIVSAVQGDDNNPTLDLRIVLDCDCVHRVSGRPWTAEPGGWVPQP